MTDNHFFVGEENLAPFKVPSFDDDASPGVTAFFPRDFAEATAPPGLSFICAVNWSFSPGRERRDGLFIGRTGVGGFSWVLWRFSYDDNWERWDWEPLAATDRSLGSAKLAASFMLERWWKVLVR